MPEGQSSNASAVDGIHDEGCAERGGKWAGLEHMRQA